MSEANPIRGQKSLGLGLVVGLSLGLGLVIFLLGSILDICLVPGHLDGIIRSLGWYCSI